MAQSGFTPLQHYYSTTAASAPLAANLVSGELAINITDGKLYYKDNSGVVQVIASKAGNVNVSSFQTSLSGLTPSTSTTGAVTLAGTLGAASGGTGATTLTGYVYGNGTGTMTASTTIPTSALTGNFVSTFSAGTTGFTPNTATTGAITLGGTLATTNGGTGLTSFSTNGAVYATSTSALTTGTLPISAGGTNSTATPTAGGVGYGTGTAHAYSAAGTSGQPLISAGAGAPAFGTLGVNGGGTGLTSLTANYIPYGNGTSAFQSSTNLTFDGTNFTVKGNSYLGGASGSQSLYVPTVSSAVNYIQASGNTTGNAPSLSAQGSDTNIPVILQAKGTGGVYLTSNNYSAFQNGVGALQFNVTSTASAVNYLQTTAATTGNSPGLSVQGSDTNIGFSITSKGNGSIGYYSNSYSNPQFFVSSAASAVNYLQVSGAATGSGPSLLAQGSDTNISIVTSSKGNGAIGYYSNNFRDPQFFIASTALAVNYLQVTGNTTNNGPVISSAGSDANIYLTYSTKGNGAHLFFAGGATQFGIGSNSSAVNFVLSYGSSTGNPVLLTANGSDTNIGVALVPKGTGLVQFGTYTSGALTPAGYITIADSNGISRRLLVG